MASQKIREWSDESIFYITYGGNGMENLDFNTLKNFRSFYVISFSIVKVSGEIAV